MKRLLIAAALTLTAPLAHARDWPQWGGTNTRNMVSDETGLPLTIGFGERKEASDEIDLATTKNVKWVAKLGSQAYGNPVVAGGRVFIGTNNASPRDPAIVGDYSVLMAFEEATGKFLWQFAEPKIGSGKVNDWEFLGITSQITVENDRVYLVSSRGHVVALDATGPAPGSTQPKMLWRFDLREELGVFPHDTSASGAVIVGDRLYLATSNGVDWGHTNIPAPTAPAFIALDKNTGLLVGEESLGISSRVLHGNWSTPSAGVVGKQAMVLFAGGDGFCYGFDPTPKEDAEGLSILPELWRFDGNPPRLRTKNGKPTKYATLEGPSEFIGTPVLLDGRVYAAIGQDPQHGGGPGNLLCMDASKRGDITKSGRIWNYEGIGRTMSSAAIHEGLVYAADFDGRVHCVDAKTGKKQWVHDTKSHVWGSPFIADGKVYVGNEDGLLTTLATGRKLKVLATGQARAPIYSTPVVANGTLYIATQSHLYAAAVAK